MSIESLCTSVCVYACVCGQAKEGREEDASGKPVAPKTPVSATCLLCVCVIVFVCVGVCVMCMHIYVYYPRLLHSNVVSRGPLSCPLTSAVPCMNHMHTHTRT